MNKSFAQQLFDTNFDYFITRKVSKVFYIIWMILLGLFTLAGMAAGIGYMFSGSPFPALGLIAIGAVPLISLLTLILIRLLFETSIALVLIAENTRPQKPESDD